MIKVLSQETIEQIAAGEVVERPLSVVKELCENAIDAGSLAITVEIKSGGLKYIRVTDNGSGIESDQVELAFLRHSTSKISSPEDLFNLQSLGFRGEALFSIAAVSKLTLFTKSDGELLGTQAFLSGGKLLKKQESAAPKGSTFIVEDLFFNTPARLKFMKTPQTEGALIEDLIEYLALSRPSISFKFLTDGKEKIFTSGNGDLKTVILELFGIKSAKEVIPVKYENPLFDMEGFIGTGGLSRGNRKQEIFFINGRFIRDVMLSKALEEGCRGFMMQHRFPFCVLNLTFPEGSTDVNVHPSKMEVRFDNPIEIQKLLIHAIENCMKEFEDIENSNIVEPFNPAKTVEAAPAFIKSPEPFEAKRLQEIKNELTQKTQTQGPYEIKYPKQAKEDTTSILKPKEMSPAKRDIEYENLKFIDENSKPEHRIIGQVFGTYWLIEFDDRLFLLDQHAAHEKVLFEKTMKLIREKNMTSQLLMPPIVISLSASEQDALKRNLSSFLEAGFMLEEFGDRDWRITGVPASLPDCDYAGMLLSALEEGIKLSNDFITERVASLSCKAAVKGNHLMSFSEADALMEKLLTLEDPYHCPHGRPTLISFSKQDLDKRFKRIV